MNKRPTIDYGRKIEQAILNTGLSVRKACQLSDVNYQTLMGQIRKGRAIPTDTTVALSEALGLPLSKLLGMTPITGLSTDPEFGSSANIVSNDISSEMEKAFYSLFQTGFRITTDHVLNWLHAEGGVLRNFDAIREVSDLYHVVAPEDNFMTPIKLGGDSLARKGFMLEDEDHYTAVVGNFEKSVIQNVMAAHYRASEVGYQISDQSLEVEISGQKIQISYRRLMARVRDIDGTPYTMVYAREILPKSFNSINV